MECKISLILFFDQLKSNPFLIGFCWIMSASILALFPFRIGKNRWEIFFSFLAIGFTALVVGYMSTLARETGIPGVVSAIISLFGGYIIFKFLGEPKNDLNIIASSLGIIFFMGFLLYGGIIGAYQREWYEKIDLPEKQADQEHNLKAHRKWWGLLPKETH